MNCIQNKNESGYNGPDFLVDGFFSRGTLVVGGYGGKTIWKGWGSDLEGKKKKLLPDQKYISSFLLPAIHM